MAIRISFRRLIEHLRMLSAPPARERPPAPPEPKELPHPLDDSFAERAKALGLTDAAGRLYESAVRLREAGRYAESSDTFMRLASEFPAMAADGYAGAARCTTGQRGDADRFSIGPFRAPLSAPQRQQAIALYRQALQIDPNHARSLSGLAYLLDVESPERIQLLEQARELYHRYPRTISALYHVLLNLGDCYRIGGDTQKAGTMYEEAVKHSRGRPEAYQRLIELHTSLGNDPAAKQWRRAVSERHGRPIRPRIKDEISADEGIPPSVWCVVANVATERTYGPGGEMKLPGTKQFAPNTKVFCVEVLRSGDRAIVLGHGRGSRRLIKTIIPTAALANPRAKLVYEPRVIRRLSSHWDGSARSREKAQLWAARLQQAKSDS